MQVGRTIQTTGQSGAAQVTGHGMVGTWKFTLDREDLILLINAAVSAVGI
jgi:hypothetical protein